MFVGVGASRVRDKFDQAKNKTPCFGTYQNKWQLPETLLLELWDLHCEMLEYSSTEILDKNIFDFTGK